MSFLSRDELIDIFWQSDAAIRLKDCSATKVFYMPALPPVTVGYEPDPDEIIDWPHPKEVLFYLEGQVFGRELYVAVLADNTPCPVVIVPPFAITDRDKLPTMFRKQES